MIPSPNPPSGGSASKWIGLVSTGDGISAPFVPSCGAQRLDVQLDIIQSGNTFSGTMTTRVVSSSCLAVGTTLSDPINGTFTSGNSFTFASVSPQGTTSGSGTIVGSRVTGTSSFTGLGGTFTGGSFAATRQ